MDVVAWHLVATFLRQAEDPATVAHLMQGTHPDVMMVTKPEDKTTIAVDAIREAGAFFSKTSSLGAGRALVILGAEAMTHPAANALLKRLEEPPAGSLLILTTSALGALPVTVRSRCWRLRLKGLDAETFAACLPSAQPQDYALHAGNLEAASQEKTSTLTQALHHQYRIIMDKAGRRDPSVWQDLERYDTIAALIRDVPQYHLHPDAAGILVGGWG
jgi:DNA polymerase III delta prime subunit